MEKEKTDRIGEVINLIKANSKDAHFAQTLIDELMTLRKEDVLNGQSLMDIKMSDIVKRHDGDMWGMFYTRNGDAIFKTKGGYTIVCSSMFNALNTTIKDTIDYLNGEIDGELTDEEKDLMENDVIMTTWCMNLPLHACADISFKYDLTKMFMDYIERQTAMSSELRKEDVDADKDFEKTIKALKDTTEIIGEEADKLKGDGDMNI